MRIWGFGLSAIRSETSSYRDPFEDHIILYLGLRTRITFMQIRISLILTVRRIGIQPFSASQSNGGLESGSATLITLIIANLAYE
jgi:hypothetical protein